MSTDAPTRDELLAALEEMTATARDERAASDRRDAQCLAGMDRPEYAAAVEVHETAITAKYDAYDAMVELIYRLPEPPPARSTTAPVGTRLSVSG